MVASEAVADRRPRPHLSRTPCVFCKGPLTVHQEVRGGVCDDPRRRRSALQKRLQAAALQRQQEADKLRQQALAWRQEVVTRLGLANPEALTLAVLPSNDRPIIPLSAERRRTFRAHVVEIVSAALRPVTMESVEDKVPAEDAREDAMLGMACATCRGYCCRGGGVHAYLDESTMRRYVRRHPHLVAEDVVEAFLGKLPQRSYRYSCVYHGRFRCTLPRDMRSDICNAFLCNGLGTFRSQLTESGHERAFAVAASGNTLVRGALLAPHVTPRRVAVRR
jgi:hypothetical protein